MSYKLVAIDMDGTLLNPNLEISKETLEAVKKVIDQEVILTLSTGRMYLAAIPFANMLQLDVPIITCNGAMTKCSKTGNVYDIKMIPQKLCSEVVRYCLDAKLSVSIYSDDDIFVEKDSGNLDIHESMDKAIPQETEDLISVTGDEVIKILFNSRDKRALERHANILYDMYGDRLNFYFSLPYFVEIVNIHANKRNALERLAGMFNAGREEIIAIGDNFNDLDMIRYAGLGVAMGNAPQYLKEAADFVTHSNDEDGVRHVLEKFILNKKAESLH